jgi:hypothetical protein
MAAKSGGVFLELELFAAEFAPDGVVMISGLLANEEHGFHFPFSSTTAFLSHRDRPNFTIVKYRRQPAEESPNSGFYALFASRSRGEISDDPWARSGL